MFFVGYTRYIEKELERLKQENKKFHDMHYLNRKPPIPPFQKGEKKSKVDSQVAQVLKAAIGMTILRPYYTKCDNTFHSIFSKGESNLRI